jgi:O-methyltransferase
MIKKFIKKQLNKRGFDIIKLKEKNWPEDFEDFHKAVIKKVEAFTMTSQERIFGLIEAVKYIIENKIEGDIVECGVWKGGSMLAAAETLLKFENSKRHLYLYDTFEGMSEPTELDISFNNEKANHLLNADKDKEKNLIWAFSSLETVKQTMSMLDYPSDNIHYIKGKVEETIPATLPEKIAILRLDTDWYESTKHELIHLFPRLVKGGVLIIDDYGFWKGARKAVDEYIIENKIQILLNRLDNTGRVGVKF